ncbi:MAG TPA: DUF1328 domain-containing protein [Terriglobia bacterium]|nr:DUF1328 domain-containing protein [Terriglobia bacterium]
MLYWAIVLFFLAITSGFVAFGVITFGALGTAKILLTLIFALFLGGILGAGSAGGRKPGMGPWER